MFLFRFFQAFSVVASFLPSCLAHFPISNNYTDSELKGFKTEDGTNYAYTFTPSQGDNATFLFLHGYPSSHRDWHSQISALVADGFGAIALDMLGFGASDMPTDPKEYNLKRLAGHIVQLLDYEGLRTVIGVGHDWGSVVLSRVVVYHQNRLDKVVWVNVGYQAPGGFVDIDSLNNHAVAEYGYMTYGYWYFFDRYDAASVIGNHLGSYWHLIFPENNSVWKNHLAPLGAGRAWLNADTRTKEPQFVNEAYKSDWFAWMSKNNAIEAGLNVYRSQLRGINAVEEAMLTDEDWLIRIPVLAVAGAQDSIARPEFMESTKAWATAGYEGKVLEGGHWLSQEVPHELNKLLLEFGHA